jgi:hypothetical protein
MHVIAGQSWGQCNFTWLTLPQVVLANVTNVSPTFADFKTQGYNAIRAGNRTEGVDFDGALFVFKTALGGPFTYGGGYGEVNGLTAYMVRSVCSGRSASGSPVARASRWLCVACGGFLGPPWWPPAWDRAVPVGLGEVRVWSVQVVAFKARSTCQWSPRRVCCAVLAAPSPPPRQSDPLGLAVIRHEIGHCMGHPHHHSNKYYWRVTRSVPESWFDGYDMMSGGNGYAVSHFNPVSKWYGSCADCASSVRSVRHRGCRADSSHGEGMLAAVPPVDPGGWQRGARLSLCECAAVLGTGLRDAGTGGTGG